MVALLIPLSASITERLPPPSLAVYTHVAAKRSEIKPKAMRRETNEMIEGRTRDSWTSGDIT